MNSILDKIKDIDNGARFYKVDLHFHTPASHDYKDKSIQYDVLVDKAIEEGLDLIAVTDHHIGTGYEKMFEAAKGKNIVILPGVEVTVQNIHIIAIFPEKTNASDIEFLLHNLGIKDEEFGARETIVSIKITIPGVLETISKAGGIGIAAHTDSKKGLTEDIRGELRTALIQDESLKILEITKPEEAIYYDGTDPNYKKKLTCVMSSDSHHPDEIGKRATWIKMSECSFQGLKQIIFEPDLRVYLDEPKTTTYQNIIAMNVTGGLYKDEIFHFNKNLNCLIGGRGAGKSAVIDFIRFTLNYLPRSNELLYEFYERIAELIGLGNSVFLYIENSKGIFKIERKLSDFKEERISGRGKNKELLTEEKVYQLVNEEFIETEKPLREIIEIEVFGQGEVFELTRRAEDQIKLIDEYIGVEDYFEKELCLKEKLEKKC